MTLTFDLLTLNMVRNVARVTVPTCQCWIVGDTTTIRFRFMDQWANTAQTDYVTFDLGSHGAWS